MGRPWTSRGGQNGWAFLGNYGKVEDVSAVINKFGVTTGDVVLQVTMTRQSFDEIPSVRCRKKRMILVAKYRRPFC